MQNILHHKTLAFVALIVWLIASWSGAHGHLCVDGQEPPVSVHMEMMAEHADHHATDEQHVDADVEVGQFILAKLSKIDLPLLIAAAFLLAMWFEKISLVTSRSSPSYSSRRVGLRPPLRAPPALLA